MKYCLSLNNEAQFPKATQPNPSLNMYIYIFRVN